VHELTNARLGGLAGFFRGAVEDEFSAVEHADAIGHRQQAIEIARDMMTVELAAPLLASEQIEYLLRRDRIEPRGRLVVQDDGCLAHRGAGYAYPFFLAAGEARGHALLEVGEGDAGESFGHARRDSSSLSEKEAPERERDVVGYTEMIEERIVLKEHPEFQTHRLKPQLGHLRDVFAFDQDFAPSGRKRPTMSFRSTLLSGGARADQAIEAPFRHVQTYVVQDRAPARLPRALGEPGESESPSLLVRRFDLLRIELRAKAA